MPSGSVQSAHTGSGGRVHDVMAMFTRAPYGTRQHSKLVSAAAEHVRRTDETHCPFVYPVRMRLMSLIFADREQPLTKRRLGANLMATTIQ